MYTKIYFGDKPVFLCDKLEGETEEYRHHPDAVFIDEVSPSALKSLLHEIGKPEFHAGIVYTDNLEKLKKMFFKHFQFIQAAGGLITNEKNQILMIFRRGKWDLPKGKLDEGENLEKCAIREVEEETGIKKPKLISLLHISYHSYVEFGKHFLKETHWYKMTCSSHQHLTPQVEEDILEIEWVNTSDLKKPLSNTYPTIIEVFKAAGL